jgi:large subunit ribosomal protein L17
MQHNRAGRKLGRTTSHRLSMLKNQLASLFTAERIVTTLPKAKELRPLAERMVTQGKRGTVHARRMVGRWIQSRDVIRRLFDEIAPRFTERQGGYLRIVKLGPRLGDGAEMAVLEFVDFELKTAPAPAAEPEKKAKGRKAKAEDAGEAPEAEAEEKPAKKAAKKPAGKKAAPAKGGKAAPKAKPSRGPSTAKKTSTPKKIGSS